VARLWAAQRVGYLSAEKRRTGASVELDEEIRMLGERYGIPTEFTSYLVTEPQLNRLTAIRGGNAMPAAAPAMRDMRFESAKTASAQRKATSLAQVDSARTRDDLSAANAGSVRRVDGRTFVLRDSAWTDQRYRSDMATTTIKPYSKAYFDVIAALPELRAAFALGSRVIAVGRDRAIALSERGSETLAPAQLAALVKAW
jgi:Ca-activated chloride channel family protein